MVVTEEDLYCQDHIDSFHVREILMLKEVGHNDHEDDVYHNHAVMQHDHDYHELDIVRSGVMNDDDVVDNPSSSKEEDDYENNLSYAYHVHACVVQKGLGYDYFLYDLASIWHAADVEEEGFDNAVF